MNTIIASTRTTTGLILAMLAMIGCNGSTAKQDAVVQGSVTIDGELAEKGVVTFHPSDGGPVAYGTILKDGTFALRIGKGEKDDRDNKIYPGEYTATVAVTTPSKALPDNEGGPPTPGSRIIDSKFSDKTTSELKYTVKSGRNIINISVNRALPKEKEEEQNKPEESEEETTSEEQNEESASAESETVADEEESVTEEAEISSEKEPTEQEVEESSEENLQQAENTNSENVEEETTP